jgi:hypothetical protein
LTIYTSNFGATVELDQKVYTWTDKVFITIDAKDWNFNTDLVDTIGEHDYNPIKVSTRSQDLDNYMLVETGPDTGIFAGEVLLTPFANGTKTFGSGPNDGVLEATSDDGITVSFEFSEDETVVGSALIQSSPPIEQVNFIGYDAKDVQQITLHDGLVSFVSDQATEGDGLVTGDRIGVYIQNQSNQNVTLKELSAAGTVYTYYGTKGITTLGPYDSATADGDYVIVSHGNPSAPATVHDDSIPTLQAGEEVTILLQLTAPIPLGRDAQFKIETSNGAIFVGTIVSGQQSG